MRRSALVLAMCGLAVVAGCAKPTEVGTGSSSSSTTSSILPSLPVPGSVTTTAATGPTTAPKPQSLPCQAMNRFVQDLFIAEKAKAEPQAKKDEILRAIDIHAGELKLNVPAMAAGVDVRLVYVRAMLTGTVTDAQKQADDAQGKVFQDWYQQNAC